ncbi:MAG TPA: hypothetical protein VGI98_03775, partial [Candidatus Limnocylindrales bacterium]
ACSPSVTGGPSSAPSDSVGPGGVGPPATLTPDATPLVRIDPSLLAVLPQEVDGLSVLENSEAEADAQANGTLATLSDGVVGALAIDPATADFVLADVVRLRAGAMNDAVFTAWRDSFDSGVCGQNGVVGHAQQTMRVGTVYVGTCGGQNPFHTYHVWIAARNLLVSASAGGKRELGSLLFQSLTP